MAKNGLGCMEKRDLLNQAAVSVEALQRWGQYYEEEGLLSDAVDFYEKAQAREALGRILDQAVQEGDLFLYNRLCRVLKVEPGAREWLDVARRAEALGKLRFAAEAYRRAGVSSEGGEPVPESASVE